MLSNAHLMQSNDIGILFSSKIYKMEYHLELRELRVYMCVITKRSLSLTVLELSCIINASFLCAQEHITTVESMKFSECQCSISVIPQLAALLNSESSQYRRVGKSN